MRSLKFILTIIPFYLTALSQDNNKMNLQSGMFVEPDSARRDLALLRAMLYDVHPGQFMHCNKIAFEKHYDSIADHIRSDISIADFYKWICALLSVIKDGHTRADRSPVLRSLAERKVFPFGVYAINDSLFISRTIVKDRNFFQGLEVLSINGNPAKYLVSEIKRYVSTEGTNSSAHNYELQSFPFYYSLIDTAQSFQLHFKNDNGIIGDTTLSGININQFRAETRRIVPPISAEFMADSIAVLTVNTFSIDDFTYNKIDHKKYFNKFFKQLKRKNYEKLIIDVRGNGGGSAEIANCLFSYISRTPYNYLGSICRKKFDPQKWKGLDLQPEMIGDVDTSQAVLRNGLYCEMDTDGKNYWWLEKQKPKTRSFKGEIIVLADGGSFSTTGHFVALFRDHHIGKIYGECTHGSFYSNDGSHTFRLPNTGILVNIPTAQFTISVQDFKYDPKGICPDVEINKTKEDLKTGSDSQLQHAIRGFR